MSHFSEIYGAIYGILGKIHLWPYVKENLKGHSKELHDLYS
jgi:hypothetical protein